MACERGAHGVGGPISGTMCALVLQLCGEGWKLGPLLYSPANFSMARRYRPPSREEITPLGASAGKLGTVICSDGAMCEDLVDILVAQNGKEVVVHKDGPPSQYFLLSATFGTDYHVASELRGASDAH